MLDDLKRLTLKALQALARERLGPGHSRLRTKAQLVEALQGLVGKGKAPDKRKPAAPPAAGTGAVPGRKAAPGRAPRARKAQAPTPAPTPAPPAEEGRKGRAAARAPREAAPPSAPAPARRTRRAAAAPAGVTEPAAAPPARKGRTRRAAPRGEAAAGAPPTSPAIPLAVGPQPGPAGEPTPEPLHPPEGSLSTSRTTPSPASGTLAAEEHPGAPTTPPAARPAEAPAAAAGTGAAPPPSGAPMREGFFRTPSAPRTPVSLPPPELRAFARDPWSLFALWRVHPHLRPGRYRPEAEPQLQLVLLDREGNRLAAEDVLPSGGHYFSGLTPGDTYAVELWWRAEGEVPEPLPLPPREVRLPPDRPATPPGEVQLLKLPWGTPLAQAAAQVRGEPWAPAEGAGVPPGQAAEPRARPGGPGPAVPFSGLPGSGTFAQRGAPSSADVRRAPGVGGWLPSSAELPVSRRMPSSAEVRPVPGLPSSASLPSSGALPSSHVRAPSSADVLRTGVTVRQVAAPAAPAVPGALPGSAEAARLAPAAGLPSSEAARRGAWHPLPGSGDVPRAGVGGPGPAWDVTPGLSPQVSFLGGPASGELASRAPRMWVTWVPASPAAAASAAPPPASAPPSVGAPTPERPPAPAFQAGETPRPPAPPPPAAPSPAAAAPAAPAGAPRPAPVSSDFFGRWRQGASLRRPGEGGGERK